MRTEVDGKRKYTCDRCGEPSGSDETYGMYDVKEVMIHTSASREIKLKLADDCEASLSFGYRSPVTFKSEEGESYPEFTNKEEKHIDCCTKCFDNFVIPAMEALGFKVRVEKVDY